MKIFVGVTDQFWFNFNKEKNLDQVVFWRKSPNPLRKLKEGDYFLFLIRGKLPRKISGCGIVSLLGSQSINNLWNEYGERNGCNKIEVFEHLVHKSRNQTLGYTILEKVKYFKPGNNLTDLDINFNKGIMIGKTFKSTDVEWQKLLDLIQNAGL
ncbi:hypothetical protein KKE48_00275 [Patescibacteria group bacterium]|nr:hypothetical protein [Patescibacteria group bacterium]